MEDGRKRERQYYTYCIIEFDDPGHGAELYNCQQETIVCQRGEIDKTFHYCLFFVLTKSPYIGQTDV